MESSTGLPIQKMMSSWCWQIGFPVIYVEATDTTTSVLPKQHPRFVTTTHSFVLTSWCSFSFFLLYSAGGGSFNGTGGMAWTVPILTQHSDDKLTFKLQKSLQGPTIQLSSPQSWVKLNRNQVISFYAM